MNVTTRTLLIRSLSVVMIGLIASTVTTLICAEAPNGEEPYWGTLKVGDEMRWRWASPSPMVLYPSGYYELKILEIRGESLKAYYNLTGFEGYDHTDRLDIIKCGIATFTSDDLWPYIYPASLLHSLLQENEDVTMQTYVYNGHYYIGAYLKIRETEYYTIGYLWDYKTGILITRDWNPPTGPSLTYTNASLTPPDMGHLMLLLLLKRNWIALVAVAHVVVALLVVFLVSVVTSVVLICLAGTEKGRQWRKILSKYFAGKKKA